MTKSQIKALYSLPLMELVEQAHTVHKACFKPGLMQSSRLLSIKTGACPEDCAYCPQSARWNTGLKKEKLLDLSVVLQKADQARRDGATRFCMGAAWREVKDGPAFNQVLQMVRHVSHKGLEVCCTLGMLNFDQALRLKKAGLFAYNHNIDSSPEFYPKIITTRTYKDRLNTLKNVRKAGLTVCTGGILGMGETRADRISFIHQLNLLKPPPESVTINRLIPIKGTPLGGQKAFSALETARVIAVCRVSMPSSCIRLSAGRKGLSPAEQFLCFYAGANSVFIGDKLLTANNPKQNRDERMFQDMGLRFKKTGENLQTHL